MQGNELFNVGAKPPSFKITTQKLLLNIQVSIFEMNENSLTDFQAIYLNYFFEFGESK